MRSRFCIHIWSIPDTGTGPISTKRGDSTDGGDKRQRLPCDRACEAVVDRPPLAGHRAAVFSGGRARAARSLPRRAHDRPARGRAALGAHQRRRADRRPRRRDRRPGGADGAGRPEGDLPLRLAGGRRGEPRRAHLPRPEPLPGEQRSLARAAPQQRAAARRPDRLQRGPRRHLLARADRRRRGGRLRRRPQRVRADEGHDRGGRRRRPLRGPAGGREEVRPPGRQGARPDESVHPHPAGGAPRGGRARRADAGRGPHGRAQRLAAHERHRPGRRGRSSPASARRRASSAFATASTPRSPAASRTRRTPTCSGSRPRRPTWARRARSRRRSTSGTPASCWRTTARRRSTGSATSTTRRSRASGRRSAISATGSSSSRSRASTR